MSCSSKVEPLQFTFQNITLTNDGRAQSNGIAVQIGTPPQTFALTPVTSFDNIFVNNIATCGSDSNSSCVALIGGGYDASASSTFTSTTHDAWNGSAEEGVDTLIGASAIYFNDVVTVASQKLQGFPLFIEATGVYIYAGLGLGKGSTFITQLLEAKMVPSRSWSLYPGMYSDTGAGSLIIGGYADRYYTGQLYHQNLSDTNSAPIWQMTGLEYQTSNSTIDLLPTGVSGSIFGYIDSYYPELIVPNEIFWKWGNATNGMLSPEGLWHTYPPGNVPTGNITVTLANGLKTTIPNEALFDPPAYTNGLLSSFRNGSDNTVFSMLAPWEVLGQGGVTDRLVLGVPYAAMVYMIMDFESQQQSIANANQAAQISGDAIPICGSSSSDGGSSNNTGAIAGGVVGGVVGLALLAVLAWFLWRRKKKRNVMAGASTEAARVVDPSTVKDVNVMSKAELPQYNDVNHISPNTTDSATSLPVQELPAQNPTSEMPDTQRAPLGELPASDGNVVRSELPA